ncbi:lactosylceramide 4-alpha-galactosyltransferase isoform X2 [Procambarus clarkii]|uniref:lactosylceramide 4-alpha-galactosyltransferase isoform X2 n=1 Tax=Procambarus clarkii TaxID=6728 RepID=UPI001E677CBF|nr:lactosylceramide 4-alpha-galactosyltransferase-like isoform X2 [Procambarus clarkii]
MRIKRGSVVLMAVLYALGTCTMWLIYTMSPRELIPEPSSGAGFEVVTVRLEVGEPEEEGVLLLEGYGQPHLTYRMWCTVEAAALRHPDLPVTLFMTSPVIRQSPLLLDLTTRFSNLRIFHLNLTQAFHGSRLEGWYTRRKWEDSQWPLSHLTDGIRWLLLWKYGGVYLDLDALVLRSLAHLPNCAARESERYVAAGVLKFTRAHPLLRACLNHFARHFNGHVWGANGPELLTQVLIDRWDWRRYVQDDPDLANELLNDPQVYTLHTWNFHTRYARVLLESQQPYALAALASCPVTAAHAGLRM